LDTQKVFDFLKEEWLVDKLKRELNTPYSNCFIAMMVLHPEDPTMVLVVDYYPDRDNLYFQMKFPGGTGDKEDKTPFETLMREAREEVLVGTPGALIQNIAPVCKEVKRARSADETDHVRYGVIAQTHEVIRPYEHLEGVSRGSDKKQYDEVIKNHRYLPVGQLTDILFGGHKVFLGGLCSVLAKDIPKYKEALRKIY